MNRREFQITGLVQGVGFRPFVWQAATESKLSGWVRNDGSLVVCQVQGDEEDLQRFRHRLENHAPPLAEIVSIRTRDLPCEQETAFHIVDSQSGQVLPATIPADLNVCDECLAEFRDPTDRRFGYPFINCTNCGPRYSIIRGVPYDRAATSMRSFPMCNRCQSEYNDPSHRRFHAQPNACYECGPTVWFREGGDLQWDPRQGSVDDAINKCNAQIAAGKIIAVKGIGGFHLVCDATNDQAVEQLRIRKQRGGKPFAAMVADVETACQLTECPKGAADLLSSRLRPIVLLPKLQTGSLRLSDHVAPDNDFLGVMLAYSPLHYRLVRPGQVLVVTSGNLADEPIVFRNQDAVRLAGLADGFLLHNREIENVTDDSVVRFCGAAEASFPVRRARGYAPLPIRLTGAAADGPQVLAVGAEIKATFCLLRDDFAYVSQHIGDMENLQTLEVMEASVDRLRRLLECHPEAVVCDRHPDYLSTRFANRLARQLSLPLLQVQHHQAHVASLIAEHQLPDDVSMLGVVMDGTGLGDDQSIWGGEIFLRSAAGIKRVASLHPWQLPGGDASIRFPCRTALSLFRECELDWDPRLPCVSASEASRLPILNQQLSKSLNCVPTSSMGRLFDAVASLLGLGHQVAYEAEAAMKLEAAALRYHDRLQAIEFAALQDQLHEVAGAFELQPSEKLCRLDWRPVIRRLAAEVVSVNRHEETVSRLAWQFHAAIAVVVTQFALQQRDLCGVNVVGLTGGVFQNSLLLELCRRCLESQAFQVLTHRLVPPNDGGLSLGQACLGRELLRE